jgi:phospholipid-translocating ATPase
LLQTTDKSGTCFIRTDQLDGETDWKLRIAVPYFQGMESLETSIFGLHASVYAEKPHKGIYDFVGTITIDQGGESVIESLSLDNTMWANTVVASGSAVGCVVYTGSETKAMINTSQPAMKMGRLDLEFNAMTKNLFASSIFVALILVIFGLAPRFHTVTALRVTVLFSRFVILFSNIIPISLRINLDMARMVYSFLVNRDPHIPNSILRNSNIPEELGRVEYLLTDKTGTLTKNGKLCYAKLKEQF